MIGVLRIVVFSLCIIGFSISGVCAEETARGEAKVLKQEIEALKGQAEELRAQLEQIMEQAKPIKEKLHSIHEQIKAKREELGKMFKEYRKGGPGKGEEPSEDGERPQKRSFNKKD